MDEINVVSGGGGPDLTARGIHAEVFRSAVYAPGKDRWYFRVLAANGEVVAQSEGYVHRVDAVKTATLVVGPGVPIAVEGEEKNDE